MERLVVLGGGESGVGTAILGKQKGFDVFVSDKGSIAESYKKVLLHNAIDFEENQHTESKILNADLVMKSPGIPEKVVLVQKLIVAGVKVISEIEFASKYTNATIVGITGSNGKTTTTMLVHHLLKQGGLNVGVGGNIGDSFAQQIAEQDYKEYVLELSSFQLDGIEEFNSHIAIITNISPDHLDRYDYDFEKYIASKFRITKNQTEKDFLIYDADDKAIQNWLKNNTVKAKLVPFSVEKELEFGAFLRQDKIIMKLNTEEVLMNVSELALKGKHNTKNAMAASMAARLLQVRKNTIAESLSDFEGVEHRLENVQKINGVQYINDSKATNVNAVYYALECMEAPTVWIVGGVDKGNDYTDLMPLVREKVKAIVCLGLDNQKIIETFQNVVEVMVETAGAEEAVKVSHKIAKKGDVVLLSPACASFDLFDSYEDRGNKFREAVKNL
ncbi:MULTISPECIES: UDP-N-acetylmuramoyl-L-alanine--D-glutamate ligase [unclassified Tenacibaculum]|uniref:UDP-N-acetylmuramoyl-L-alanine--D-glutamate ligase n=1 Tax=unclassified Tenacibaculum TaxID=2635139 RepID=UPI001F1BD87B|nr:MULTISPECIES: UDP-N-acetylmuramoyl-L-alanine--D-glutamate ligase [unclassified Tenacibaculum]MCF2875342.1 UDP-N-acetylmuramoyl-L-alanine--D-glutamate ligase [Tenacibaculum sp. Cn5-1]MCF2935418.1 UDP-N-acetylmuramoyl-L-alanine--D-glutamate ligase [Tenacibaculum sp. Cn5-34]MCG7511978.1 UDP-N-acetylmuramoyl-L-alanine--D-glutamate ligase [Tenacibaculum sp. Cn5-46]